MREQNLWSQLFQRRPNEAEAEEDDRSRRRGGARDNEDDEDSNGGVFLSLSFDSSQTAELSSEDDVESNAQSSLLLPLNDRRTYDSTTGRDSTTVRPTTNRFKAKSAWKKLANNVDDVLVLQDMSCSSSKHQCKITLEERAKASAIRSGSELTLTQCLVAVLLYLLISIAAFSFLFDHLTIIDSCYFAVVTFTTIGYGDLVPHDTKSRIFTALFALMGVTVLGIVLGHIGGAILDAQEAAVEAARKDHAQAMERIFQQSSRNLAVDPTTTVQTTQPGWSHLLWGFFAWVVVLILFALILADDPGVDTAEGWSGALYFAIITATTVGYGDMAPTTQRGRLCSIICIPIAVAVMGHWISSVATHIMERRQMDNFRRKLLERELQLSDLDIMDEDGDGQVTQLEFMRFMLVAMNKVDERTLESLEQYFERLDVDNTGTLSKDDLITNAKAKLRQTNRKLELAAYKQRLLAMGRQQESKRSLWT